MGYSKPKRYETWTYIEEGAEAGEPPTTLRLQCSLSGYELRRLEEKFGDNPRRLLTAEEVYPLVARHLDWWSVKAINDETGNLESVPVPTEENPDQMNLLPDVIVFAAWNRIRTGPKRRVEEQAGNSAPSPTGRAGDGATS